ncbi:putative transport protein [Volucribacter psittacicida]|uniref:Putative transport protein n=1 Tax=Volucribacter psittacicida TaxID=203482 RepID=A0A4R1FVF9_9PAST|nr:DUF5655 domain-containing protein [Volucribacter psittacicida]TCJ98883.1 putative transport protein [Volucribacter psittacicida]
MLLFHQKQQTILELKEKTFRKEKDIQFLVENNLNLLTGGLEFVCSEFSIKNYRIDTLAFNPETQSFVIIEYKRNQNDSVVDQGISYLNIMLENKAEFIIEYNEKTGKNLKRDSVDFSQSKVLFIAPSFNNYQRQAVNFKDLPIELWEIKSFENNIIVFNQIKKTKSAVSFKQIKTESHSSISELNKELKTYTEDDHLEGKSEEIKELYDIFKNEVLRLDNNIEIVPVKMYIAFKLKTNVIDVLPQKKNLKIWINMKKGQLDDPKKLTRDISNIGHNGNGDYDLTISNTENLEYIMSLIKQVIMKLA